MWDQRSETEARIAAIMAESDGVGQGLSEWVRSRLGGIAFVAAASPEEQTMLALAMLLILTGASGAGKTSAVKALRAAYPCEAETHHFDEIGVPSEEDMLALHGSGETWQRAATGHWIDKLAPTSVDRQVVLEGQMRLSFVREAIEQAGVLTSTIMLIDCDDDVRRRRLKGRGQPELATGEMMNWAAFLRREAASRGERILDTSHLGVDDVVQAILAELRP